MKKWLLIIGFILCFNSAHAISTVDELVEFCHKDPEEISLWITFNIKYVSDQEKWGMEDYWQSPTETLTQNKEGKYTGDCEDYAILAYACMKKLGYKPKIFIMYEKQNAHAVCLVRYKRAWYYLGEELLTRTKAISYMDVVRSYNFYYDSKYTWYYFLTEKEFSLN